MCRDCMDMREWEGQVVEGVFPLRRYLGGRAPAAVFLTERGRRATGKAAIKLVPADRVEERVLLARWKQTRELSHPHLLQLYEMGRCRVSGVELLYLVMEYADDGLSQLLPHRALTPAEAQEMLLPVVAALSYLHGKGFAHGHLTPANILAVGDQLKLSSDGVCRVGKTRFGFRGPDPYDAPEVPATGASPAGDVWSLGVTLVEALTRKLPEWGPQPGEVVLPETLPESFRHAALNCLRREPEKRWVIADVAAFAGAPATPAPRRRLLQPRYALTLAVLAVALGVILGGPRLLRREPPPPPPALPSETQPEAPPPPQVSGRVVQQVLPEVPQKARDTIEGRVRVSVRVTVDPSGKVTGAAIDSAGPSRYFAQLALNAARQWTFEPAGASGRAASSEWVLRFDFEKDATRVLPELVSP